MCRRVAAKQLDSPIRADVRALEYHPDLAIIAIAKPPA
jgi:hypothetical protein